MRRSPPRPLAPARKDDLIHAIRGEVLPDDGKLPRVWMRHGPFSDAFQV